MKNYEGYKYIEGGVCAAKGFRANGLNCGLNPDKNKNDLCLVAADTDCAITVAKSVVGSSLLKCAIFGADANWGRILCAIGYADAEFDISLTDVDIASPNGSIGVCRSGSGIEFSEEEAKNILLADEIYIKIRLNQGSASAKAWGCDLTYDYVKINGDYRS